MSTDLPAADRTAPGDTGLTAGQVARSAHVVDPTWPVLGPAARERMARAAAALRSARKVGSVYGLTTGVGALRSVPLAEETGLEDPLPARTPPSAGTSQLLRLWRSHAAGLGPELDDATARATMSIRLHQVARGHAGVDPELAVTIAAALRTGAVPRLRAYGGIGTGDLTVLSQLGLTLIGEQPWRSGDTGPVVLDDANALPFISSNAATLAVACLALDSLRHTTRILEQVAGLSWHALGGTAEAYDARVHAAKRDPDARAVASRMRELCGAHPQPARRLQDPFCLRAIPQVHSPLEAAVAAADEAVAIELDAGAENPFVAAGADGSAATLHHGQFLTQRLAAALDGLRGATHPALSLSSSRTSALMSPDLTGLQPFLVDGAPGSSGLMILEYVAADLVARAHHLATPASTARAVASLGLEDHASFSTQAAWLCRDLAGIAAEVAACELVAAVRALQQAPERLAAVPRTAWVERTLEALPYVGVDHVVGDELATARELVTVGLA